jgi:hypothetical protein
VHLSSFSRTVLALLISESDDRFIWRNLSRAEIAKTFWRSC